MTRYTSIVALVLLSSCGEGSEPSGTEKADAHDVTIFLGTPDTVADAPAPAEVAAIVVVEQEVLPPPFEVISPPPLDQGMH